jgi:cell division septal protein FtsQ
VKVKTATEKNFRRAKSVKPVKKRAGRGGVPWRAVSLLAVAMLAVVATYRAFDLVLHASTLQVQRIVVHGNVRLSSGEVQTLVAGLRGTNILTADIPGYRERLMDSPWVADAALRRVLPSTIEVFVSERRPMGLSRINGRLYLVDRTGMLIDEYGPQYVQFDLPIIDGAVRAPARGQPLVDEARVALAARVLDSLAGDPALADRVSQIDVADHRNAVVLLDDDPTLLYLGDERFAERLRDYIGLAERLRERVPDMEYVDLRFGKHVTAGVATARGARSAAKH